jgi:hypothetical protein
MMHARRLLGLVTVALTLGALAGCDDSFDPYSRLTALRVLAIRSEPASPAPGEPTTLSALVYTPDPSAPITYAWAWCPLPGSPSEGYRCHGTEAELVGAGSEPAGVSSLDLGSGATASLTVPGDPAVLAHLCASAPAGTETLDCEGGFPLQVMLTVTTPNDRVEAVRTLRLRFDPATPANDNPHIDALSADLGGLQPIGDQPALVLPRKQETLVRAAVPESCAERYMGVDDAGNPASVRERLVLSWFVESGSVSNGRTSFVDGFTDLADALETKWKPASPKDFAGDTARLLVVVRDSRGGVGWRGGIVRLGPAL